MISFLLMMIIIMMNTIDGDDIDDDRNLIMHDCVYRDDDECDDHRYAAMCQFAL